MYKKAWCTCKVVVLLIKPIVFFCRSRRHQRLFRKMTSEKRAQKFYTDDASLPRSGYCFWRVETHLPLGTTNQKHYPDLGNDTSSVWNFCARFSDVISRGNCWWRREMSAVLSVFKAFNIFRPHSILWRSLREVDINKENGLKRTCQYLRKDCFTILFWMLFLMHRIWKHLFSSTKF